MLFLKINNSLSMCLSPYKVGNGNESDGQVNYVYKLWD